MNFAVNNVQFRIFVSPEMNFGSPFTESVNFFYQYSYYQI